MQNSTPSGSAIRYRGTTGAGATQASPAEFTCTFRDPFAEGCDLDSRIVTFARDPGKVIVALRVRASIVSNDGLGSARDGFGTRAVGRVFDFNRVVIGIAQTPFVHP
jgi:hypothetical protein